MIYTDKTKKALRLCYEAHKDQLDKSGMPYVFHPFHLAEEMKTEETTIVALLHDVIEDTEYTLEDLKHMGFSSSVIEALSLLTHDDDMEYMEYVQAIKNNPIARTVKLADLAHNSDLTRLDIVDEKALLRREKYQKAKELLMHEKNCEELQKNLEGKGYVVHVFERKEQATHYLASQISQKTVGFGGSVTLREMNLYETLSANNKVFWHDEKPSDMTVMETRTMAARADIYISSVNGVAKSGEIVNIDNTGNRVAAISYGPSKVYLIIGMNKVEETLEKAIFRARNIAGPKNAQRLKRNTPCAVNGDKCYDCHSPERICRNLSVLWEKPTGAEYEVILIGEQLGF